METANPVKTTWSIAQFVQMLKDARNAMKAFSLLLIDHNALKK